MQPLLPLPLPTLLRKFREPGILWSEDLTMDSRRVWDTHSGEETHTLQHNHIVRAVAFPPNSSSTLATGGMEKKLRIFDLDRRSEINAAVDGNVITAEAAYEVGPNVHKGTIKAIVWTADPNILITAADDKLIRWWDLRTQQVIQEYEVHGEIGSCEFSNVEPGVDIYDLVGGGKPVLTVAAGHAVYFFGGLHARTLIKSVNMGYEAACVALHPSQKKFVTGSRSDTWVKVYDWDTEKEIGM